MWEPAVTRQVRQIMELPLNSHPAISAFSLAQVPQRDKQVELEFDLRVENLSLANIARLNQQLNSASRPPTPPEPEIESVQCGLSGLLHGFMDLVVVFEGQYFILDYKTNWLGPGTSAYHREAMEQEMVRHNYHLQYAIYAVALKRFLEKSQLGFNYAANFGGVYYLFVRGMAQGDVSGIYYTKPPLTVLDELDRALGGSQ